MKKLKLSVLFLLMLTLIFSNTGSLPYALAEKIVNPFEQEEQGPSVPVAPGAYTFVCENEKTELWYEPDLGQFYVEDKKSKAKYYSNPQNRELFELSQIDEIDASVSLIRAELYEISDALSNVISVNSYSKSLSKGGQTVETTENGLLYSFEFPDEKVALKMSVNLTETGIKALIDTKSVQENKTYIFKTVSPLPFFNAGTKEENGYIFVPDGSGALIEFNTENPQGTGYQKEVYNENPTKTIYSKQVKQEEIMLPVFGIIKDKHSHIAVISKSPADSAICAFAKNELNELNHTYAKFLMRAGDVFLFPTENKADVEVFQKTVPEIRSLLVEYILIPEENASYTGLALAYRDYLVKNSLIKSDNELNPDLYLSFIGSTMKKKPFLGIPIMQKTAVTTFTQTEKILDYFKSNGVGNISIKLQNWSDGTSKSKMSMNGGPDSKLGGKSGYKSLLKYAQDNNVKIYPDGSPVLFKKGNFLSVFFDYAQNIRNIAAKQYEYFESTYFQNEKGHTSYLLAKKHIEKNIAGFSKNVLKHGADGISFSNIGISYADFMQKNAVKQNTNDEITKALSKIESGIMVDSGNDYLLKYAGTVLSTPESSSGNDIFYTDIPFFQIALHGLVNLTLSPINESPDSTERFLKAVETGTALYFALSGSDGDLLRNSYDAGYYYASYSAWNEKIADMYSQYYPLFSKIYNSKIIAHSKISQNIYKTVYENQTAVYVNYGSEDEICEDGNIPAKGFVYTN